jgi:hypothetical protein
MLFRRESMNSEIDWICLMISMTITMKRITRKIGASSLGMSEKMSDSFGATLGFGSPRLEWPGSSPMLT